MNQNEILSAVNQMRADCKANDDKRDSGLPHDIPEVKRIDDLQYGPDPKWNLLDLYLPKNKTGKLPVIINIHGGGWVYGTKETYQFYGLGMAKRGFAFVNPNYKLGPEVQFPKELDQVNQYIHWVDKHADEYNLDKDNVFLIGDSAGGQMVEQYTAILTNPDYRQKFGYDLPDLIFRAVALNSPATFMLDKGMISGATMAYFTPELMQDEKIRDLLNVEKYITSDFLPTFISTANQDFIHDCSVRLDGFLRARGVEVIQKSWGDKKQPESHVFLINQKDELASQANDEEAEFFKKHMNKY
ncbi:alpha/beta hydrolase [Lactobacillus hominis]|uniref:Triacylglycerol lipase n=1 Tax=Lactobacillus hominis DSM 23910 = CRBIP 24.179 TaxID=1423758 RepID=I7LAQ2_9LACO|nr:alpha/beta hydrolase [Lactobacillus hominis]KRM84884.1 esterase lipase [Lactobacillus hominis DSM 23910 = CRBIP 24.179]MCT3348040.1 alpha/beta hydrolase [Lactobacillus hominis]CCI82434.1 Triacylglycerol lipase [Lactobacillus hominis DSM 23910 = CRBIP 24.179]